MLLCVVLLHVLLCVVEQAIASVSIKTVKITYFAERGDKTRLRATRQKLRPISLNFTAV